MPHQIIDGGGDELNINTDGSINVGGGGVASGAADSGNPVKVGGKYNLVLPTLTDGQRGDVQLDASGYVRVGMRSSATTGADAQSNSYNSLTNDAATAIVNVQTKPQLFNGTSWDRQRGTSAIVILASAARTTTQASGALTNYNHRGIRVVLNTTVIGTGSVTVSITGTDANGITYTLLTGAAVVTNTTNVYTLSPNIATVANVSLADHLPRTYGVTVTANNANSATYSVAAELLL